MINLVLGLCELGESQKKMNQKELEPCCCPERRSGVHLKGCKVQKKEIKTRSIHAEIF